MIRCWALAGVVLFVGSQSASAQAVWTGVGVGPPNFDGINWSNPYNWQNNSIPLSGSSTGITFASAPTGVSVNNLGSFTLNDLTFQAPVVLTGGQLVFNSNASGGFAFLSQSTSVPVTVNNDLFLAVNLAVYGGADTLTLSGVISSNLLGFASLTVQSSGVIVLANSSNSYNGGTTINSGVLAVSGDSNLGNLVGLSTPVTVGTAGTLRYTANTTTSRTLNLNGGTLDLSNNSTLTLSGARVNGGYMRGGGAFALTGGTALTGVTTYNSTTINQTGTASLTNFTNGGTFTTAPGQTLSWNGGINQASGNLTINGTANVSDLTHYGTLNIPAGGTMTNVGSSNLVFGGGSTSFVGSVANPGGKIDLGGQQLVVRGGLLVTNAGSFGSGNGVRNGTTVADYGALVKGTGPYQAVITQNGGQYLPGNSPGTSQVGQFFVNGGGSLIFEITDAGPSASFPSAPGTAGNNPGWGLTQIFNSLEFTATPSNKFTIDMRTQLPPPAAANSPGLMSSFDPARAYSWLIFDLQPGAAFNGTFNPNAINFVTTQVANPTAGGAFSLSRTGGQVFLTFTPAPEPAMILGAAFLVLGGWRMRSQLGWIAARAAACRSILPVD